MKPFKKTAVAAIASMMLMGCTQSEKNAYTINGNIEGLPDSTEVLLTYLSHSTSDTLARAIVNGGKFTITGEAPDPRAVQLSINGHYGYKTFMLENADIDITGKVTGTANEDGKMSYDLGSVTVSGSAMTDSLYLKMAGRYRLDSLFNAFNTKYAPLMSRMGEAHQAKNTALIDSIRATDEYKVMSAEEKYLFTALDSNYKASVAANSNTFWGPLLMIAQVTYLSPGQREMYDNLSDEAKQSYYGRLVYDELYPVGAPGDKMPAFDAVTIDGSNTSLTSICKDKKYIILDFWASWCGPCKREIPNLKNIYADWADKGFDIVSISIDQEDEAWRNAVKAEDLKWVNIRDTDHSIAEKYKVSSVPTIYIVDTEGRLAGENLRGEELAAKIKELMTE